MLEEEFTKYVNNYDLNDQHIRLKYNHSFRVMKLQVKYAKKLGFSKEDIEIAKIIGLLHDFGRFEQLRVYHSYDDLRTIDHADYSCTQLFEKGNIKKFVENEEWYPIIEFAIRNHNKQHIEKTNNERFLMHAKLIRDTDKIDIIYLLGVLKELDVTPTKDKIKKEILDSFFKGEEIGRDIVENRNEHSVIYYGFAFDINNTICLKEFKKNIKAYAEVQKDNKELMEVYKVTEAYIKERLKNEGIR